jgi:hypothetical protein
VTDALMAVSTGAAMAKVSATAVTADSLNS